MAIQTDNSELVVEVIIKERVKDNRKIGREG